MKRHVLIVGPRQVGKTTVINHILSGMNRPVCGFRTKKEAASAPGLPESVYIYEAGSPETQSEDNRVGICFPSGGFQSFPQIFDRFAPRLLTPVPSNAVIVFDEIGFMEVGAEAFCDAILSRLDGDIPVIAAVKNKPGIAFLDKVRQHPNCRIFYISEENRDALAEDILEYLLRAHPKVFSKAACRNRNLML